MSFADLWERVGKIDSGRPRSWLARYGVAVLAVGLATFLEFCLRFWLGPFHWAFILYYPAIVLVAMWAGFGPGLLATSLAAAAGGYFFLEPTNSFVVRSAEDLAGPTLFALIGACLTILTSSHNRAMRSVRLSESELNRAQAVARVGSWRYDIKQDSLFLSDETCRIMGLPAEATVSPRQANEMLHPDDRERIERAWDKALASGVWDEESRVLVEGCTRWVRIQARIEFAGDGRPSKALGSVQDITERKLAEDRLQEYEKAMEGLDEMILVVDRGYRYVLANSAFLKRRGLDREQLIGHPLAEMMGPEVFDTFVKPKLDECFEGRVVTFEKRYKYPMLGERDFSVSYFPLAGASGVERVAVVMQDITDRLVGEQALRASEDRFRDLVEHSEDLVCTHDLQGNLLSVNPAPARILGYTVDELLKIPMRDLIVPEGREIFDQYLERLGTTGGPEEGLLCVMARSGEVRTWEFHNTLRTEGVPTPIVRGMAHDITERRRAQLALGSSERRYRTLFEKSVAGVGIIGLDGRVIDCNDAWAHIFGYSAAEDCRGSQIAEQYANPEERKDFLEELQREGAFVGRELEMRRKDGTAVWLLLNTALVNEEAGGTVIQSTVFDVTSRKMAEQELLRNEERFRVALKESPIVVFNQDCDLRYTWVYNLPSSQIPNDVLGKTDDEILGAQGARRLNEFKLSVLRTGVGAREEFVVPLKGRNQAFDITIEPLFDAQKKVVGITGAAMDIARLRELTDSLRDDKERLVREKSYLENEIQTELGFEEIVGQSSALRQILAKARVVAPTDSTVLLLGATGTGKELVARAVHALSSRRGRNFIKLNCAAVPSGLLESELFGHERGAFTSAVAQKIGRLELADGGTLFLDEVGELPLELQPKLLRVLQDREFERLGGVRTLRVDVRIIAATNRDLQRDIAEGEFRQDLFYRLNVFPILLPTLRERKADIPLLVQHFVQKYSARMGRRIDLIPSDTMQVLQNWNWPGNVRELENMIERMVILTKGNVLAAAPAELWIPDEAAEDSLTEMEREHIIRVLRETNGVLSGVDGAASRLGVKRTTLQSMLKRLGIEPHDFRSETGTFAGKDPV